MLRFGVVIVHSDRRQPLRWLRLVVRLGASSDIRSLLQLLRSLELFALSQAFFITQLFIVKYSQTF